LPRVRLIHHAEREARGADAGRHPKIDGRFDPRLLGIVEILLGRL